MTHDVNSETGLLLSTERSDYGNGALLSLTLRAVYITPDGEIRNYVSGGFSDEDALADLIISAQLDHTTGSEPYGWRVEYREVFSVDLERAETAVKTLRKIKRALDRASERDGYPETFAQYVVRVSRAIGADRFGWARKSTGTYATGEYVWTDASGITSKLRRVVDEFNAEIVGQS